MAELYHLIIGYTTNYFQNSSSASSFMFFPLDLYKFEILKSKLLYLICYFGFGKYLKVLFSSESIN